MNDKMATAMRRALEKTRAFDPGAATAIIQAALNNAPTPSPFARGGRSAREAPAFSFDKGASSDPERLQLPGAGGMLGLSGLSRHHAPGTARRPHNSAIPKGTRVELRHHRTPAGARDVRLFVPSPRQAGHAGFLVMLHGCTQSPEDFARGTRMDWVAEKAGFIVAYPRQTAAHNAQSCWNWFRREDQAREQGEPQILAEIATDLAAEFGLERRVFAAGLSAGGAMAAVLAETHPDLFAAVGIHSGLPAGAATDVASAFAAMRSGNKGRKPKRPAIVFHGTADATVSVRNARLLVAGSGIETRHVGNGRSWSRLKTEDGSELWLVEGGGHAWFGGERTGSYADPAGPDASAEMLRFFLETMDAR